MMRLVLAFARIVVAYPGGGGVYGELAIPTSPPPLMRRMVILITFTETKFLPTTGLKYLAAY